MEYCVASFAEIIKVTGKTMTEEHIAIVVKESLKGLSHLHGMKKMHGDLKVLSFSVCYKTNRLQIS